MTSITLIVDSRRRDQKSETVVKYTNLQGRPIDWKPVRKITPDLTLLTPLARFIAERLDGAYIGGFLHRDTDVRVEGPAGSEPYAGKKPYGFPVDARLTCKGYLWPVFEPEDDETEYVNRVAEKMASMARIGGRIIVRGEIFNVC